MGGLNHLRVFSDGTGHLLIRKHYSLPSLQTPGYCCSEAPLSLLVIPIRRVLTEKWIEPHEVVL